MTVTTALGHVNAEEWTLEGPWPASLMNERAPGSEREPILKIKMESNRRRFLKLTVSIHMHAYTHIGAHAHTHRCTYKHTHRFTYTHTHTGEHEPGCTYSRTTHTHITYMCVHVPICVCMCTYVCVHMQLHACACVCIVMTSFCPY